MTLTNLILQYILPGTHLRWLGGIERVFTQPYHTYIRKISWILLTLKCGEFMERRQTYAKTHWNKFKNKYAHAY